MATVADIDAAIAAIAQEGTQTVTIEGRSYTYRNVDDLFKLRDRVAQTVGAGTIQSASVVHVTLKRERSRSGY